MESDAIKHVLSKYGIKYQEILLPEKGYRNTSYPIRISGDKIINIILYKDETDILDRVKNANKTGNFLALKGFPARNNYSDKILRISNKKFIRYVSVYNYLPGKTIPWEAYTMERMKELGHSMADMHTSLKTLNTRYFPSVVDENLKLNELIAKYTSESGVRRAIAKKLGVKIESGDFTDALNAAKKLLDQQVIHMDFVRGNILFEGNTISGVLDFEKCGVGATTLDVARTLAFLLVDCKYKDEAKIRKYFLRSGYIKRGDRNLTDVRFKDKNLFDELVNFFVLHDFYKFLLHNPYEYLSLNEHFARTKNYLLKTGIIAKV
ncbi:MAG TPA: phosphotransferase [Candidatus Saccharimonadales bacterium]|nr:phosphotransferase [Candidatus Saccharimonadales bacterium]